MSFARLKSVLGDLNSSKISSHLKEMQLEHYEQKMMAELIFSALDVKETRDWTKSYRLAESLQLRVWERLNTGHWSQVDHAWRQLYALLTLLRIHLLSDNLLEAGHLDSRARGMLSRELVRMADVGWLMGGPAMDNLCSKVAQATCEWISRAEKRSEDASEDDHATAKKRKVIMTHSEKLSAPVATGSTFIQALPKVDLAVLDLVTFLFNHKSKNSPVIIQGATSDWSASTKWNFDYLRDRFGPRCVPVEVGSRYTDENWTQTIMSIDHFVTEFITGASLAKDKLKNTGYLAQHQLLDQIPELMEDICIPEFCLTGGDGAREVDVNAWFGPAGTVSPLHTDPRHNILCQVRGSKYLRLYPASESAKLYPYEGSDLLSNTSRVDLEEEENKDDTSFPKFTTASGWEGVLEEGDALYIPPGCWHFVKSLSPSMSVSVWFD